jgi:ribosomal protein S12 methylthiotransferase accessory factor
MQISVEYLENLKLQALFDDFNVKSDQPVRYKGDGTAPGPFDYFLASSAMCAAYFVLVYCKARSIPTQDIRVTQDNIVDPENRYRQTFKITLEIPEYISNKDRQGMIAAIDRCTVKKTIEQGPEFIVETKTTLSKSDNASFDEFLNQPSRTYIKGKDCSLEETIHRFTSILDELNIKIEISSWRNPVAHVWSVHIRDADSPICFSNGKGTTKEAALCSALGEYLERLSCNYFYADYFFGEEFERESFVHYPQEKWFEIFEDNLLPVDLMDDYLKSVYSLEGELKASHLVDTNSGIKDKVCALPYIRQSDGKEVFIPVALIGNLFVSNGMSAGNSAFEARVQCLSEIFERAVKNEIITKELTLPDIPNQILSEYPNIMAGIEDLREKGYPIYVKDASLGGKFPVACVTLMNPKTGGVFASFGAHPKFEVALERSLTELLQGRSFEGLNDVPAPSLNSYTVQDHNNIIEHFIDSTGVISWKFFAEQSDYEFTKWDFSGNTEQEFQYLMEILKDLGREVYIADYNDLGVAACRILVPNYSEIYEASDLIWENNNRALRFRESILNIHNLTLPKLSLLVQKLEESEIDNYMPVSELIGIAFDENEIWGQSTIAEIKGFIYLALGDIEQAAVYFDLLNTFHDGTIERKKFYQAMHTAISLKLRADQIDLNKALEKMYGAELTQTILMTVEGNLKFTGLTVTNMQLSGIEKHQKLIHSYRKLHQKRARI